MLNEIYGERYFTDGNRRSKEIMCQLFGEEEAVAVEIGQFRDFTRKQLSVLFLAFSVQKSIIAGSKYHVFFLK